MSSVIELEKLPPAIRKNVVEIIKSSRFEIASEWYDVLFEPDLINQYNIVAPKGNKENTLNDYVLPLLDLLAHFIKSPQDDILAVYLDECLRYAPHRSSRDIRISYFSSILPRNFLSLVSRAESKDSDSLSEYLNLIHAPLLKEFSGTPVTLVSVGDCLMTDVRLFLNANMNQQGLPFEMRSIYFSANQGVDISIDSVVEHLKDSKADFLALSFLSFEGLPFYRLLRSQCDELTAEEIDSGIESLSNVIDNFIMSVRDISNITILLHNAGGLPLGKYRKRIPLLAPFSKKQKELTEKLNKAISGIVAKTPNCILIDETSVLKSHSPRYLENEVVPRRISRDAPFHTTRFAYHLVPQYSDCIKAYSVLRGIKLLLIDFDNTLWNGVVADEEVQHFKQRQLLLKKLRDYGILLAAVSKNNEENIPWDDMSLSIDDFVSLKINWNPKFQSVNEIAEELNLGHDSFLFIDDNPVEREMMASQLPMVRSLDATLDSSWSILEKLLYFPNTSDTEEAMARTMMYREQADRRKELSSDSNYDEMMRTLNLKVVFGLAKKGDLNRVHELVQRTNQFNTTTIRYQKEELSEMLLAGHKNIYIAELSDKFGNLGIVNVIITEKNADNDLLIDSFIMSCRAMGFGLEQLALSLAIESSKSFANIIGKFSATQKNEPASGLFREAGFEKQDDNNFRIASNKLNSLTPPPEWFEVVLRR